MIGLTSRAIHDPPGPKESPKTRSSSLENRLIKALFQSDVGRRRQDLRLLVQVAGWLSKKPTNSTCPMSCSFPVENHEFRPKTLKSKLLVQRYREISTRSQQIHQDLGSIFINPEEILAKSCQIRSNLMRSGNILAKIRPDFALLQQTRNDQYEIEIDTTRTDRFETLFGLVVG